MDKVDPAASPPPVADTDNADLTGRALGDYQIIRRLGKGGMGQVFLAEQVSLRRKVALKFLRADLVKNPTALERFRTEATAVARVNHANIVQVYAVGEIDGIQYMALEYVEGRTLREFVDKKGPPDPMLAVSIMRQAASALLRAAELGIIHRDIKPDNILLTRKGEVKIADFGLARILDADRPALNLTQSGVVMGTPLYMSPEQVEGKALDTRSDIYSFGVSCYHMLTGQPPFLGATAVEVALQHLQKEPVPLAQTRPDLPEGLCAIVHKMMAKSPADRYQTSRDLLRDLVRLRDNLTGTAPTLRTQMDSAVPVEPLAPTPVEGATTARAPKRKRRRKRSWLPATVVTASLLAALAVGAMLGMSRRPAAKPSMSGGTAIAPIQDVKNVEAILNQQRREQGLLAAIEPLLAPENVRRPDKLRGGLELCMQLAVFYLDGHRLDDAKLFFHRLESIKEQKAYNFLGRMGRAIVLALQNRAKESNVLFRDIAGALLPFDLAGKKRLEKIAEGKRGFGTEFLMLGDPSFRFWIAEALRYNQRNGIPDSEVPPVLLFIRRRAEAGEKKP